MKIICIGGSCVDYKTSLNGELLLATTNILTTKNMLGGVGVNTAINLARLGAEVIFVSVVGADLKGSYATNEINKISGIEFFPIVKKYDTGYYFSVHDKHGELLIAFADSIGIESIDENDLNKISSLMELADAVFLETNLNAFAIGKIIQTANQKNLDVYLDPVSVPKTQRLSGNTGKIKAFFPNQYEWAFYKENILAADDERQINATHQIEIENIVVKRGSIGVDLFHKWDKYASYQVEPVEPVDVTGAGDAFNSGFIMADMSGLSHKDCFQLGQEVAVKVLRSTKSHLSEDFRPSID